MNVVGSHFRPEFINRIDESVVFHPLAQDQIRALPRSSCVRSSDRLQELGTRSELSPTFMDHLVAAGYDPVYGARPLKRAIQQMLENPLASVSWRVSSSRGRPSWWTWRATRPRSASAERPAAGRLLAVNRYSVDGSFALGLLFLFAQRPYFPGRCESGCALWCSASPGSPAPLHCSGFFLTGCGLSGTCWKLLPTVGRSSPEPLLHRHPRGAPGWNRLTLPRRAFPLAADGRCEPGCPCHPPIDSRCPRGQIIPPASKMATVMTDRQVCVSCFTPGSPACYNPLLPKVLYCPRGNAPLLFVTQVAAAAAVDFRGVHENNRRVLQMATANVECPRSLAHCPDPIIRAQLFVSPVTDSRLTGRVRGQTLRYPAGRPIHGCS